MTDAGSKRVVTFAQDADTLATTGRLRLRGYRVLVVIDVLVGHVQRRALRQVVLVHGAPAPAIAVGCIPVVDGQLAVAQGDRPVADRCAEADGPQVVTLGETATNGKGNDAAVVVVQRLVACVGFDDLEVLAIA